MSTHYLLPPARRALRPATRRGQRGPPSPRAFRRRRRSRRARRRRPPGVGSAAFGRRPGRPRVPGRSAGDARRRRRAGVDGRGRRRPGHDRPRGVPGRRQGGHPAGPHRASAAHPRGDHRGRGLRRHRGVRHVRGQRKRGAGRRAVRRQAVHGAGPARARQLRPDQGPALPRLRDDAAGRGRRRQGRRQRVQPGARRHGRQHDAGRSAADHDGDPAARRGRTGRDRGFLDAAAPSGRKVDRSDERRRARAGQRPRKDCSPTSSSGSTSCASR